MEKKFGMTNTVEGELNRDSNNRRRQEETWKR